MTVDRPGGEKSRRAFSRYVGIDYSGAETAFSGLAGLRAYSADRASAPAEVRPPAGSPRHWTRRMLAEWLVSIVCDGPCVAIGVDHGFSFPLAYFERHGLAPDWPAFLDDFCRHWPTDEQSVYVDFVREAWLRAADADGSLERALRMPDLESEARRVAAFEGWILGVS